MRFQRTRIAPALLGASGVAAAAYYAHGLERVATDSQMRWWAIACAVQLVTAPAILAICLRVQDAPKRRGPLSAMLMSAGTILFSGTLYMMALGAPRWLGAVTPLGGLLLILGWLVIVIES